LAANARDESIFTFGGMGYRRHRF